MNYQYLIISLCCLAIAAYITLAALYNNNEIISEDVAFYSIYILGSVIFLFMIILIFIDSSSKTTPVPGTASNSCNIPNIQYASDCLFRSIVVFILLYIFYICNYFFVKVKKFTSISLYFFLSSVFLTLIILLFVIGKETTHGKHMVAIFVSFGLIILSAFLIKKYVSNDILTPTYTYNPNPDINPPGDRDGN